MSGDTAKNLDLPENPAIQVIGVITMQDTQIQTMNDVTIEGHKAASERLSTESTIASHRAEAHLVGQVTSESHAGVASMAAEGAKTDNEYFAQDGDAQRNTRTAEIHHIANHVEAAKAEDRAAQSSALERISQMRIAGAEIEQREQFATEEVEIRTQNAVVEQMRSEALGDDPSSAVHDQENVLKMASVQSDLSAPKLG
ncbi:MAG: hypothetical protein ACRBDL_06640 [Alphaproteobacteria bacterium]